MNGARQCKRKKDATTRHGTMGKFKKAPPADFVERAGALLLVQASNTAQGHTKAYQGRTYLTQ